MDTHLNIQGCPLLTPSSRMPWRGCCCPYPPFFPGKRRIDFRQTGLLLLRDREGKVLLDPLNQAKPFVRLIDVFWFRDGQGEAAQLIVADNRRAERVRVPIEAIQLETKVHGDNSRG